MPNSSSNLLLNSLSPKSSARLLSLAKDMELPTGTRLAEAEEEPRYAYFMTSGICSVVVELPDGGSAEVSLIGGEGLVGSLHLLGPRPLASQAFIQIAGSALRVPFADTKNAFSDSEEIRNRILEFVQYQSIVMMQITACNKLHDSEARLARWLLMVQDRTGLDILPLTQEFLAQMLGAQRTTVAVAAGTLQKAGLIEYRRGRVQILNRERLLEAACTCYEITRRPLAALYQ